MLTVALTEDDALFNAMTSKAQELAGAVLKHFQADKQARENLGFPTGDEERRYLAAAQRLTVLAAGAGALSLREVDGYLKVLVTLLDAQSDDRAELLAERSLQVLRQLGGLKPEKEELLVRALNGARAQRLVNYFRRMAAEQGREWVRGLERANALLELMRTRDAEPESYEVLLGLLERDELMSRSAFAELAFTCRAVMGLSTGRRS